MAKKKKLSGISTQPVSRENSKASLTPSTKLSQCSPDNQLHLVAAPLGNPATIKHFNSFEELRAGLVDLLGSECHLFVIQGNYHQISHGPWHYLLTSDGERHPLFDVPSPDEAEPSDDGYVGYMTESDATDETEEEQYSSTRTSTEPDDEYDSEDYKEEDEEGMDDEDPYGDEPELQIHNPGRPD